jgi:5-methylthioadenosine/S-adenosylhomocysteine deaminase
MDQAQAAICDLLIVNGYVATVDERQEVHRNGAVAVADNRILAVGPTEELQRNYAARRTIDAAGGVVMPGLVNTHNHTPLMVTRGMVEDLGFAPAFTPNVPQSHTMSDEQALALARLGIFEMLRFGSTTIVDFYNHADACARAAAEIGVRAFVGGRIVDADMAAVARGEWRFDRAIGQATLKENLDLFERWHGRENGRIRAVLGPHAADTCSRELLAEVASVAWRIGASVHTHLAQSQGEVDRIATRYDCKPSEVFTEVGLLNPNLVAAHCIHLDEHEIMRVGSAGIRVAHSPTGNAVSGRIAPIRALEAAGATITLCTDTKSGDMFEAMRTAVQVARVRGAGYDMDAATVMTWGTRNGAAALGLGDELGMLAPGRLADILILDRAPNLCPLIRGIGQVVYSAVGMNVDTVIVDGRIVLAHGELALVDGAEIVRTAQRIASDLWTGHGH